MDARELAEDFARERPMAGNVLRRMQNGQGEYLVDSLSDVGLEEPYNQSDFVNDDPVNGPSRRTAKTVVGYLTDNDVLKETESGYELTGEVTPEEVIDEIRSLDYESWIE